MLLQKASDAKRSYGTLLNVNSVQFGDNHRHMTEYNEIHFKSLLLDCYKKANIDPATVEYVEAYGSGIKVIIIKRLYKTSKNYCLIRTCLNIFVLSANHSN